MIRTLIDRSILKEHYNNVVDKYKNKRDFFTPCSSIAILQVLLHQEKITKKDYLQGYKMILEADH